MLKKDELENNINTEFCISREYLKDSRYGLCRYISDICSSIELSNEVASIGMIYVNYFFVKKCYLNYEKLAIACSAILLACKVENVQGKLNEICKAYLQFNSKIFGQLNTVIKSEDIQKIKDKITISEIVLLKCLNFEINVDLPNDFIYVYSAILYPDNEDDVIQYAIRIASDSFFTYVNHLYKRYVVAIACIIMAAKFLAIPSIFDKDFKHLDNMRIFSVPPSTEDEFNRKLLTYENRSFHVESSANANSSYFQILEFHKKIHPYLEIKDLMDCIKMIMEFYEDSKAYLTSHSQ